MNKPKLDGESIILYAVLKKDGGLIEAHTEFDDANKSVWSDEKAKHLVCLDVTVTETHHVAEKTS